MTHLGYIAAAYGAAFLVIAMLAAWVLADLRAQKRRLAWLEREGAMRPRGPR